jgi:hypothetical protein
MKKPSPLKEQAAIVVWIADVGDEFISLVFDDLQCIDEQAPARWRTQAPYTWHEYDKTQLLDMKLSERQLADIGLALVARLAAFRSLVKTDP